MNSPTDSLISILQASLAPVTVISGSGLLLSSMTSRFGRTSDRIRVVMKEYEDGKSSVLIRSAMVEEVTLLYRRLRLIRTEIVAVASCIFCVILTILFLFANLLYKFPLHTIAQIFFVIGLLFLIVAIAFFIADILASLQALKVSLNARPTLHEACLRSSRLQRRRRKRAAKKLATQRAPSEGAEKDDIPFNDDQLT